MSVSHSVWCGVGVVAGGVAAAADVLAVPMAVFQLAFSAVVSLALWRLTAWQRRSEGVEARLHEAAARLVDERFRGVTAEVDAHVRGLLLALEEVQQRARADDRRFADMADRDLKVELTLSAKLDLLKDYVREFAAGRADLDRHEAAVDRRLAQVERKVAGE
jgi:hypothetical protein